MLKWFGFQSGASEGGESGAIPSDDVAESSTSLEVQDSGSEKRIPEVSKQKEDEPFSDEENSGKSYSARSISGAFGLLGSFASAATKTAHKLKESVDEKLDKTIIGDFQRENEKFVKEKHSRRADDPVPPWIGYNEEKEIKSQILALSADERHFLRDPPSGVDFYFDLDAMMPVALTILAVDDNLQKMRFNLVPKKVKEERFWRNYFYRVSLIKQSSQLSTLAQTETKRNSNGSDGKQGSRPDLEQFGGESNKDSPKQDSSNKDDKTQLDCVQDKGGSSKTLSTDKADSDTADWEKDLQDDLQDFEFVSEDQSDSQELNPEWEKEIESMLGLDEEEEEPIQKSQ